MNKATPGPCKEVTIGPTSHGGVYKVAYFFNSKYACVPKEEATRIIIHEYDEKDRSIYRDYISCGPDDEAEYAAMELVEHADKPQPILSKKFAQEMRQRREVRQSAKPAGEERRSQERRRERNRSSAKDQEERRKNSEGKAAPKRQGNKDAQRPPKGEQRAKPAQQGEAKPKRTDDVKRRRRRPPRKPSEGAKPSGEGARQPKADKASE